MINKNLFHAEISFSIHGVYSRWLYENNTDKIYSILQWAWSDLRGTGLAKLFE